MKRLLKILRLHCQAKFRYKKKKMSNIFQKHVQKNPVRDYSLVEKGNTINLRMPLGMRTNTK